MTTNSATCPAIVHRPNSFKTQHCGRPVKRDGFCGIHAPSLATTAPAGPNFGLTPTSARHTIYYSFEVTDGPVIDAYGVMCRVTAATVSWESNGEDWKVAKVQANGFKLNKKGAQTDQPTSRVWYDRPGADTPDAQHLYDHAVDASRDLLPTIG